MAVIALNVVGILVGWNVGVVGVAHAVHAHVSNISLWTALGISFVTGTLCQIFRNPYQGIQDHLAKKA